LTLGATGFTGRFSVAVGIVSLFATVLLAFVGFWLALSQTRLLANQQKIAAALQRLELQEKTTVLAIHAGELKEKPHVVIPLLGDARAGLAVFDIAATPDQDDFLRELDWVLRGMGAKGPPGLRPEVRAEAFMLARRLAHELEEVSSRSRFIGLIDGIIERLHAWQLDFDTLKQYLVQRSALQVQFHWDALVLDDYPVRVGYAERGGSFTDWYHPWYWNGQTNCGYGSPGAEPIRVGHNDKLVTQRARVAQFAEAWRGTRTPVWHVVPTYSWDDEHVIVLDGNHRLAALQESGLRFRVLELRIVGPLDPEVLPDVLPHAGAGGRL
jgi:hypothetical protein